MIKASKLKGLLAFFFVRQAWRVAPWQALFRSLWW
jgi:hypothetical protein